MAYPHAARNTTSSTEIPLVGSRHSVKRPRERSTSPRFDDGPGENSQPEIDSEDNVLSLSDLIRPLSTTPSPEPSLHFGTPPTISRLSNAAVTSLSQDDSNRPYAQVDTTAEDDLDDIIDDSKAAEMRKAVIDWGLVTDDGELNQNIGSRERKLTMMVMALTHPARPTASQIAAQADHIRALLAERSVMVQQLEDLNEFRHADRVGFERTAQALNARVVKGTKSNGSSDIANEGFYQDERTQHVELHARNERLHTENVRLERELKDAKREIVELRQNGRESLIDYYISPRASQSVDAQSAFHSAVISPTPNPRGRPRKYPLPSPTHTPIFHHSVHSNPAAQLPVSSASVLNPGLPLSTSAQPPPEKRMRPTQPDARAELLLAAARRVGKDRVVEVLEGPEHIKQDTLEPSAEIETIQPIEYPQSHTPRTSQRESISAAHSDQPARRGRPAKASASFPSTARHQFNQFSLEESNKSYSRVVRGTNVEIAGASSDTHSANNQRQSQRSQQPQQVIVAFTGNPQADAQACLDSFVAQYPGIQPAPSWRVGAGSTRPDSGITGELQTADAARSAANKAAGGVQRTYSTPELAQSGNRNMGLENLLSAARTVLRARSRSTTPTPRRHISSGSELASPYRSSPRPKNSRPRTNSGRSRPNQRRHSSPAVPVGDSDTEPEDSPKSHRVYSALDVLADQAAAVRTFSPDPPADGQDESPEQPVGRLSQTLGSPALLSAFRSVGSTSLLDSSPGFSFPPSDLDSSPVSLDVVGSQPRSASKSPFGGPILGLSDTIPSTRENRASTSTHSDVITVSGVDNDGRQRDSTSGHVESSELSVHTPPRSQKARGKQRV
ncbi:hypothetical protein RhiJN_16164 [Ceratobasidium sp. AG-Ba]|nr:hypothetical protein RhiJN_16164 [Ceratobasidium sp. AG-Ba]